MRHLTQDQLRAVARRLRPNLPPAPELPPMTGTPQDWSWTYFRHPELAAEHEAMRAAHREWRNDSIETLAIELNTLCGCGYRLARFIAEQSLNEPQLKSDVSAQLAPTIKDLESPIRTGRDGRTINTKPPAKPATVALPASVTLAMGAAR